MDSLRHESGYNSPSLTVTPVARTTVSDLMYTFAGGPTLLSDSGTPDVLSWVDWEETTLREALLSQDAEGTDQAIKHLQSALGSNSYMVGDSLTLADVVIYVALLPIQVSKQQQL